MTINHITGAMDARRQQVYYFGQYDLYVLTGQPNPGHENDPHGLRQMLAFKKSEDVKPEDSVRFVKDVLLGEESHITVREDYAAQELAFYDALTQQTTRLSFNNLSAHIRYNLGENAKRNDPFAKIPAPAPN